jgi:hypothetical protein
MSPGPFHVSRFLLQQESYQENAISCCLTYPKLELKKFGNCGIDFVSATVAFWDDGEDLRPFLSIEIFIPSHWSSVDVLFQLDISIDNCSVISLMITYVVHGVSFPFNMINTLHYNFLNENNILKMISYLTY